jgi:BlaI family penicillinase repressor
MAEVSISDAEWQVMNVVWDGQPMTAQEVIGELEEQAAWAPATVKTMLHRLVKKNVLTYELQGNRYVYRSRARRADCVRQASRSFLERVFSGESAQLMAHFLRSSKLSPDEIAQLRRMLNDQEGSS